MQILASRKRIVDAHPLAEYRLLVPFEHLLPARIALISMRSSYGVEGGPHARLFNVIAPIDWLEREPGLAKYEIGRDIGRFARHIEAVLLQAVFPEMTANPVPPLYRPAQDVADTLVGARINDISDGYRHLHHEDPARITAATFDLDLAVQTRAA